MMGWKLEIISIRKQGIDNKIYCNGYLRMEKLDVGSLQNDQLKILLLTLGTEEQAAPAGYRGNGVRHNVHPKAPAVGGDHSK